MRDLDKSSELLIYGEIISLIHNHSRNYSLIFATFALAPSSKRAESQALYKNMLVAVLPTRVLLTLLTSRKAVNTGLEGTLGINDGACTLGNHGLLAAIAA